MRKYASVLIITLLLLPFSMLRLGFSKAVLAADCLTDQANMDVSESSAALTIRNYGHGQTFTPSTINRLQTVRVFLRGFTEAQSFKLTVSDLSSGTPEFMGSVEGSYDPEYFQGGEVNPNSWLSMGGWGHGEGLEVVPDRLYGIYLESDGAAMWARSSADVYARGTSIKWGVTDPTDDFGFMTCGAWATEESSTTSSSESSSSQSQSSSSTSSSTESSSTSSSTTIPIPTLAYIVQDEEQTSAPLTTEVDVDAAEELIVVGQGVAGYTVTVLADNTELATTTVSPSGIWQVTLAFTEFENGSYHIRAYARDAEGETSATALLFQVKVAGASTTSPSLISPSGETDQNLNIFLIAGIVLIVSIGAGVVTVIAINKVKPGWLARLVGKKQALPVPPETTPELPKPDEQQ